MAKFTIAPLFLGPIGEIGKDSRRWSEDGQARAACEGAPDERMGHNACATNNATATAASCATMNAGTLRGSMPAKA